MAHPTENALGSSTSQSETNILAKSPDEQSHSSNTASVALRHSDRECVTLSGSPALNLSHEMLLALPLGPASTSLGFASTSRGFASAPGPSASHTLALSGFA